MDQNARRLSFAFSGGAMQRRSPVRVASVNVLAEEKRDQFRSVVLGGIVETRAIGRVQDMGLFPNAENR